MLPFKRTHYSAGRWLPHLMYYIASQVDRLLLVSLTLTGYSMLEMNIKLSLVNK